MSKRAKLPIRTIKVVSYLLILLPVALAFLFVYLYGVNVVFRDQWGIASLSDNLSNGTLGVLDIVARNFGGQRPRLHNIFFPQVTMLLLAAITKYNVLAEMYLILTCLLVTLVCLLLVFRDSIRPRLSFLVPILFIPVPFLVFSLRQHENMLWGFQMTLVFAQTFGVLAFYFLHVSGHARFKRLGFLAALGSATVATFSSFPGIFVWPAGLLQLLVAPIQRSSKIWRVGVWTLVGAVEWAVYFRTFASPTDRGLHDLLRNPTGEIESFLILLGRSLFGQPDLALASGILMAGLVAVIPLLIYRGGRPGGYSFWLALLLFSLLVLAAIMVGRGVDTAWHSRYVTFSLLAVIGVYAILVKLILDRKSYVTAGLLGILSLLVVLSVPGSYSEGIEVGTGTGGSGEPPARFLKTTAYRERAAFILATYESQPDEFLEALNAGKIELLRDQWAPALERRGYSVFSEPRPRVLPPLLSELSPVTSSTLSEVESVSEVEVDQEDQPIPIPADEPFVEVTGWAVDAEVEDVAGGVYIDIDGELFPAFYGTDKNGSDTRDLADYYGVRSYEHAVFERAVPVSELGPGTHELSIIVLTNDKKRYYQPEQAVTFEIR